MSEAIRQLPDGPYPTPLGRVLSGSLPAVRILLVRSARTAWDESARIQGDTDLPPTPAGLSTLISRLQVFSPSRLAFVLAAPDEASIQTARLVASIDARSIGHPRVRLVPEAGEPPMGVWTGMRAEEMQARFPTCWRTGQTNPIALVTPGGSRIGGDTDDAGRCVQGGVIGGIRLGDYQARLLAVLSESFSKLKLGQAAGLVLRPVAHALARKALLPDAVVDVLSPPESEPSVEWIVVRGVAQGLPAPASTPSAA